MTEKLFDYGEAHVPASLEVAFYEAEQKLILDESVEVAAGYLDGSKTCGSLREYEDSTLRAAVFITETGVINSLEATWQLDYIDPND